MSKLKENIELHDGVRIAEDVKKRIKTTGVRGLNFDKATELGVFQRIANLLSAAHITVAASYNMMCAVDVLLNDLGAGRNEIKRSMSSFYAACDKFFRFWSEYYTEKYDGVAAQEDTELLERHIMDWMQIPMSWQFGEPQNVDDDRELAIKVEDNETLLFSKTSVHEDESDTQVKETYAVLSYDRETKKQKAVHTELSKADANMIAKRLSADNPNAIYTSAIVKDVREHRIDVIPFKVFRNAETIGKITKYSKT